ncbi:hypothetical protein C427_3116 [Paraglaciecola psychrophila 170]|uniref:Uncharacterized protein n=1 Tax=Paraglaciecola psychrophila 170 TaxID=1129794 RepID=K7AWK1_9ALTE|nr:hypothetical protein C427_3116 [Paraglaciecola psychrophila 170]GAC39540.1 hypothetical protein GPSY_3929 [Paraglaciecola psychrophila 170]
MLDFTQNPNKSLFLINVMTPWPMKIGGYIKSRGVHNIILRST